MFPTLIPSLIHTLHSMDLPLLTLTLTLIFTLTLS